MSAHHAPSVHDHATHGHAMHEHVGHDHAGHAHGGHGGVVHAPNADAGAAYRQAYELAQPEPGGTVVRVELEAREADWRFTPDRTTRAWTFNGQVPGPGIEA